MHNFKVHTDIRFDKDEHAYFLPDGRRADASVTEIINGGKAMITTPLMEFGSAIHQNVQNCLEGNVMISDVDEISQYFVTKINHISQAGNMVECEKAFILEYDGHLIGGSADAVCSRSIIEIKTGKPYLEKQFLQTSVYAKAFDCTEVYLLYTPKDHKTGVETLHVDSIEFYFNLFLEKVKYFFSKQGNTFDDVKKISDDDMLKAREQYEYHQQKMKHYDEQLKEKIKDVMNSDDVVVLNDKYVIKRVESTRKTVDMVKAIELGIVETKKQISYRWNC